jgi:hypothetical protein
MALKARFFCFLALVLCVFVTRAQEIENSAPQSSQSPLFWADGITQIDELDDYQKLGLNVVVVRLNWLAAEGGEISAQGLAPQRAFAEAAAAQGLKVIYALPAAPTGLDGAFRLSADSDAYISLWTAWLQDAMASLGDTPNLIGWMLPDDPRGLPLFDDVGLRRWLGQNYASVEVINRQWNTQFESMDDIGTSDIAQIDAAWRGAGTLLDGEGQNGETQITRRAFGANWAFHPASLALAHYKWDAYRALLTSWVGAVRGEDRNRLVFSGRLPDYAQLLSLPAGIDVAVPDISPGVAEEDIVTHNPQALDIARRGGAFGVWPVLSPRAGAQLPAAALPDLTRRWIQTAWARGARGAGFDSWRNLVEVPGLASVIASEITKLSTPQNAALWNRNSVNTTAILLTPLADGATLQFGAPPNQFPRGLYGFGENLVPDEPSNLVWMMRWGTAFGGVDYLSPDDLSEANLARYTTILAPQTLSVSAENTRILSDYVAQGGVLVADLGLGALQNGGQVNALPPPLAALFGVPNGFDVRPFSFNLSGVASHPLFPSWSGLIEKRPGISLTLGDGPNSAAFAGPVGFTASAPNADILASGPRIGNEYGVGTRVVSAQLTVNGVERGYAIFAPFRLWSFWRAGHAGFDTHFGDLMSRGAAVVMPGATSLVPSPVTVQLGATLFPAVINHAGGVMLSNHNAPGAAPQLGAVQTSGAGDWLWSNAITHFDPAADFAVAGGRIAPIDNPDELENRARPVALYDVLASGETHALSMRPIAAQNLAGGPLAAQIELESARQLKINLWPGATGVTSAVTQWQTTLGPSAPVRLTVVSSLNGYRAAPNSRHRLVLIDYSKPLKKGFQMTEKFAVANQLGRLQFEFSGTALGVNISPVS